MGNEIMTNYIAQLVSKVKLYIACELYEKAFSLRYMNHGQPDYLYTDLLPSQDTLKNAFKLFLKSAKLGHDNAQYQVAKMYYHGYGVPPDKEYFEYWSIKAYEQDHAMALFYLADYHRLTQGQVKLGDAYVDLIDLAYEEYEVLAKSNIAEAQEILGDMYRIGEGNKTPDREKAIYWYTLASENGMWDATDMLEHLKSKANS